MGFGSLGMGEIILIFLVILIFFGAKRLPELARSLGKGIKEFKNALNDVQDELTLEDKEKEKKIEEKTNSNKES